MRSLMMLLLCLWALSQGLGAVPAGVRVNGVSLVPVRAVAERLGMKVKAFHPGTIILAKDATVVRLTVNSAEATVNDRPVALAGAVRRWNGQTYAPGRLLAEVLDTGIVWDAGERVLRFLPAGGKPLAVPILQEKILFRTDQGDRRGNIVICSMNPDGSGLRRLTDAAYTCGPVTVSPDGAVLAFTANRDGENGIYVMHPDGTGMRLLYPTDTARFPCYSADGRYLYYLTDNGLGRIDKHGQGQQGIPWHKLTKETWDTKDGEGPSALVAMRDGRLLVTVRLLKNGWSWETLYRVDFANRTMTPCLNNDDSGLFSPTLSVDGTLLAVQRLTAGKETRLDLCVMNPDGSGKREVTGEGDEPAFSPDGRHLVFTKKMDLYVINRDGTGLRQLTETNAWESSPRWVFVR
ncbi:MAG: stalk domain-containing protein [Armatimonadota bacterium]